MARDKILVLSALILFSVSFIYGCAHRPKVITAPVPDVRGELIATAVKTAMPVEERLVYAVDWRGIYAGKIIIETKEAVNFNRRPCYYITVQARPNRFLRLFYDVRYFVQTTIDKETLRPLRFYKKRVRGNRISEETITFNYENNTAVCEYTGTAAKTIVITQNAQSLLSSLYYFRLKELALGKDYPMDIVYNAKVWPLVASINNFELIKMYHRQAIKAFAVKLSSKLSSHITGEQKIKIYFANDQNHTPLFFNIRTKIGPLSGVLEK
jgi:hypothetical protein